jgi:hypothetical protein
VDLPGTDEDGWSVDLGDVRESARVYVNGKPAGVVVAHPFRIDVIGLFKPGRNQLVVEVTNLSANRIRDLDRRGVAWKKFHDINLVDHYISLSRLDCNLPVAGARHITPQRLIRHDELP